MSATIPETMLLSDLLKATGYDCPVLMQGKTFAECTAGDQPSVLEDNKEVSITENGTIEITPSEGKDAMKKVTANVNVPSGGGAATAYAWKSGDNYSYYDFSEAPADQATYEAHKCLSLGVGMAISVSSLTGEVESYVKVDTNSFTIDGEITMTREPSKDFTLWS